MKTRVHDSLPTGEKQKDKAIHGDTRATSPLPHFLSDVYLPGTEVVLLVSSERYALLLCGVSRNPECVLEDRGGWAGWGFYSEAGRLAVAVRVLGRGMGWWVWWVRGSLT